MTDTIGTARGVAGAIGRSRDHLLAVVAIVRLNLEARRAERKAAREETDGDLMDRARAAWGSSAQRTTKK